MRKFLIFLILFIMAIFVLAFIQDFNVKATSNEYRTDCKGMDLINTSYCLNNQVKSFYKYNISEINSNYSIERIKEVGATCWHYAQYYYDNIDTNRFFRKKVLMSLDNKTAHEITIISDKTGYCTLDQLSVKCQKLGDSNES